MEIPRKSRREPSTSAAGAAGNKGTGPSDVQGFPERVAGGELNRNLFFFFDFLKIYKFGIFVMKSGQRQIWGDLF